MADLRKYIQAQPFTLAGSGVVIGNTTMVLSSFNGIDGVPLTLTDVGTKGFMTIEPGNGVYEEQISFTGETQNANGTCTIAGVHNVTFIAPYTETSGFLKTHAGGVRCILSNTSGFYNELDNKENDETIIGTYTFTNPNYPRMDTATPAPTDDEQLATKKYVDDTAVSGAPNATTGVKGIVQLATDAQLQAGTETGSTGASVAAHGNNFTSTSTANKVPVSDSSGKLAAGWGGAASTLATLNSSVLVVENPANATATPTASKIPIADSNGRLNSWITPTFGGTGTDGALTITSGTTTIDLANAAYVIKNYTSISITGTGALNFSNPATNGTVITLKSQGGVTLTSSAAPMLTVAGMGAAGGATIADGKVGISSNFGTTNKGLQGGTNSGSTAAGAGGNAVFMLNSLSGKSIKVACGAGGGGGGTGSSGTAGAAGGAGGGALIIECGGAWNFTTASGISANGSAGAVGTAGGGNGGGGSGGGGGGGTVVIAYTTLTANTGTITVAGGAGGVASTGSGTNDVGSGGGGGGSVATNAADGGAGVRTAGTGGAGGAGGNGQSLVVVNTEFF